MPDRWIAVTCNITRADIIAHYDEHWASPHHRAQQGVAHGPTTKRTLFTKKIPHKGTGTHYPPNIPTTPSFATNFLSVTKGTITTHIVVTTRSKSKRTNIYLMNSNRLSKSSCCCFYFIAVIKLTSTSRKNHNTLEMRPKTRPNLFFP